MAKGIGILFTLILLSVTLILLYQYSVSSLGATDVGASTTVADTAYEPAYNGSRDTSIVAVNFSKYIIYLVGAFSVIMALVIFVLMFTKKRSW